MGLVEFELDEAVVEDEAGRERYGLGESLNAAALDRCGSSAISVDLP